MTTVRNDIAVFGLTDLEIAKRDAAQLQGGDNRRVIGVHVSPFAKDQNGIPIYFAIVEGQTCPCCQQKIQELGKFGEGHHTEDRIADAKLNPHSTTVP